MVTRENRHVGQDQNLLDEKSTFGENLLEKKEKLSDPNPNPTYNTLYLD